MKCEKLHPKNLKASTTILNQSVSLRALTFGIRSKKSGQIVTTTTTALIATEKDVDILTEQKGVVRMQIVIEIPEHYYENNIKNDLPIYLAEENVVAILPKGHGRLIDADALAYELKHFGEICLDEAMTLIEADTESENKE